MRRIEVATGIWVVDNEAGIGNEQYGPAMPEPRSSDNDDGVDSKPYITGNDVEQHHRNWVLRQGWNNVSRQAIDEV